MHKEKELTENCIYEGRIFTVKTHEVEQESGRKARRDVVYHHGGACVLALDENENIFFVRQYRFPVREELLELPAGKLEKDEDPLEAAERELEEETGYKAQNIKKLCEMIPTCGYSSENIHIYLAKDLVKTSQNLDEGEFLDVEKYSFEEALRMVLSGEIKDGKTQTGILMYNALKNK